MNAWDVLLSFAAVLALCLFCSARCRVPGALAPLASLSFVVLYFTLAGVLGLLRPAGWLFFLLALAAGALALRGDAIKALQSLWTPGFALFLACGLLALGWLALREPEFWDWDEFSLWGTAAKLLVQNDRLYTTADIGWFWTATQSPALPLLGYFAQFFGAGFAAWKVYWAVDLLLFACLAAVLCPLGWPRWRLWLPFGGLALALPFVLDVPYRLVYMSSAYFSAYGDLPAGILAGAALLAWFALRREGAPLWPALLALAAAALVKDNTLPIALVAAGVMAADALFFPPGSPGAKPKTLHRAGLVLAPFGAAGAAYLLWLVHRSWANAQNTVTGGGQTGASGGESLLAGLLQLFGLQPKSERFAGTITRFGAALADRQGYPASLFGAVLPTAAVALLLTVLAIALYRGQNRRRLGLVAGLLALGFAGYQLVLLVSYGFLFKIEGLSDWQRYQGSYLGFWLLAGLGFAALALADMPQRLAAEGGALAAATALLAVLALQAPAQLTVLGYPDAYFAELHATRDNAAAIQAALVPGERVFFVAQGGDGGAWFQYSYFLLPNVLDYSISGGGSLPTEADAAQDGSTPYRDAEALRAYLADSGCDAILVYSIDDWFAGTYGSLFEELPAPGGPPQLYRPGEDGLYRRAAY